MGGTRSELLEALEALGVRESTAATWVYFFRSFVRTGTREREI